jgi:hypothetical protein
VGKSGRTWLRVLLNKYLSLHYEVPFLIEELDGSHESIPRLCYDHEISAYYRADSWLERLLGKHVVPDRMMREKKVILLFRDPRDVVVSLFFHRTKRSKNKTSLKISDFIRHEKYGIASIVRVQNIWYRRLKHHKSCLWLRYEDIKTDPSNELLRMLSFLGVENINPEFVQQGVTFADFKNMKRMEAKDEFGTPMLRPSDPSDTDSFKVRRGVVGGYVDYLSASDLSYVNRCMASLADFYGYGDR